MQAINQMTASLQEQILKLDASVLTGGAQLSVAMINAHELLQETRSIAKTLNNNMLIEFLNANTVILYQLEQLAEAPDENNPLLTKASAIMQQISLMYQEAIVPMLTRLNNLSSDNDDMQKITAITSLGNEIITYSSQMNQFNEKFSINEKIFAIFGIILMLSSISIMVAILSKPNLDITLLTALTIMALGCSVCKKAMQPHATDPGTDLIVTSVKKMEPLIFDIAKGDPQELAALKVILNAGKAEKIIEQPIVKPLLQPTVQPSAEPEPTRFMDKIKGMLDLFHTKK